MSCRPEENGTPQCPLGNSCRTVEIRGKSLSSIIISREIKRPTSEIDELTREYDLMVVLESPNRYDDIKKGIGFDDNFKKLISFVKKAGFSPNRTFVTFLVKCNPPKRKPTIKEIKACQPYIYKEIQEVDPKVIMTLGSASLRLFNLKGGINTIKGKVFKKALPNSNKEYNIIPSYDLAYFKYSADPKVEARAQEDYRAAFNLITKGTVEKEEYLADYELIDSVSKAEQLIHDLKKKKFFAFDTESRALPFTKEPLICFSFCWDYVPGETNCAVLPIYQHDPDGLDWKLKPFWNSSDLKEIKKLLHIVFEDPSIAKCGFNIKYDINVIRKYLGIKTKGFCFDPMLQHHLINEQKPHDLEYLADLEFGIGDYSNKLKEITGKGKVLKNTYDHVPDHILWPYAANDAESCWRLGKLYYNELKAKPHLWKLYCEEVEPLIHTLTDSEWHGHYVDTSVLRELKKDYESTKESLLADMKSSTWEGFNPLSPNHVRNAFIQLGLSDKIKDPKKVQGYNTSKEVLLDLQDDVPLAGRILKYRNTIKILKTYLENVENDLDSDGRIRYSWMIHGTSSGRLSCRFYHQIPNSDKERKKNNKSNLRDMLVAGPGNLIVSGDASQIELRVMAILSKDQEMLRMLKENEDIHVTTTELILPYPELAQISFNRTNVGKRVNFGLIFGSEGFDLVRTGSWKDEKGNERPITWNMLNKGMDRFRDKFKGVADYIENVPIIARENGGIYVTPFGRERRMGLKLIDKDEYLRKAAEREVINFSIQSTAWSITARTLNLIKSWIDKWRLQGLEESAIFQVNTVHDQGAWEVRQDLVNFFNKSLQKATERPIPELDGYRFPWTIGIGRSWAEAEEDSKD